MVRLPESRGVARWAAPGLFVLVALFHLHQNRTANLHPWFGGGFGMFSTNDRPWPAALSIEAWDSSGETFFVDWVAADRADLIFRNAVTVQPDSRSLIRIAEHALDATRSGTPAAVRNALGSLKAAGLEDRVMLREDVETLMKVEQLRAGPGAAATSRVGVVHARARVWRLVFDGDAARFRSEPLGEAGEARRQP